jgi:protoheme IX farnesyltransferase
VATAATGYVLAAHNVLNVARLTWTLLGTMLAAYGANALNQWMEAGRDARMVRTCRRPLPTRRISGRAAFLTAIGAAAAGVALLAGCVNVNAAALALAAVLIYVGAYTPLKVRTPLNTLVGAVVGGLPPLVGWVGASGQLPAGGWVLGGILVLWQIPHFLALAWLYREDYERGGFRMLPATDPGGYRTGVLVVIYALVLILLTLQMSVIGQTGRAYVVGALLLGVGLLSAGLAFEHRPSHAAARRLFVASIIYLPALLALMVLDRR